MHAPPDFDFTLPRGYWDDQGQQHRHGRMRLATALDEIEAIHDPRVQANEAYLPAVLLARVVTQLGSMTAVTPEIIARLYAADFLTLQDVYLRLNSATTVQVTAVCPHCQQTVALQVAPLEV